MRCMARWKKSFVPSFTSSLVLILCLIISTSTSANLMIAYMKRVFWQNFLFQEKCFHISHVSVPFMSCNFQVWPKRWWQAVWSISFLSVFPCSHEEILLCVVFLHVDMEGLLMECLLQVKFASIFHIFLFPSMWCNLQVWPKKKLAGCLINLISVSCGERHTSASHDTNSN